MNLQEELKYLAGLTEADVNEKSFSNFRKVFKEDVKEFGLEEATKMYATIYGLSELSSLNEEVLIEGILNERGGPNSSYQPSTTATNTQRRQGRGSMPFTADDAVADNAARLAQSAANSKTHGSMPFLPGDKEYNDKLLAGVKPSLFSKIKNFFTGQSSSLKNLLANKDWAGIAKLPIFKGALAAGGVVAVIAILKKLFKGKIAKKDEVEIKAKLEKKEK